MEIPAAPSASLDPTPTADNGAMDKNFGPSAGFAGLLFSALSNVDFNAIPAQTGEAIEAAPVAASEGDLAMAPLAQRDKTVENDPAGDSVPERSVSEKEPWAPSPQGARPQNGEASESGPTVAFASPTIGRDGARDGLKTQVSTEHAKAQDNRPDLAAPPEDAKKASLDPANAANDEQMAPASVEQPAESTITHPAGADAKKQVSQGRANPGKASSAPPGGALPKAAILSQEVVGPVPAGKQPSTPPNDAIPLNPSAQGQSVARGQVSASEKNLGQIISAIARDREDGVAPGLSLGDEPQTAKAAGHEVTQEPPRLSSVQPVDPQPGERQFQSGDGYERPLTRRQEEAPVQPLRDAAVMAGAFMARGHEIPRDFESLSKWRPTVERLADDIVSHARLGRTEAVLQLDPPELGKIKIDLHVADGKLHARIIAEGHDSKQLIEAHLPELRQALAAGRLDVIDLRVSQGNWSGMSGDFPESFHRSPQGPPEGNASSVHPSPLMRPELPPGQRQTRREAGRVSLWA